MHKLSLAFPSFRTLPLLCIQGDQIVARLSNWVGLTALVLVFAAQASSRAAVPPAENLMPNSTKGFVAIGNVDALTVAINKTQIGQMTQEQAMKPFVEDSKRQITQKWNQTHRKLGITF